NCQILWPQNESPRLVIHCIQKRFRKRDCNLKIRWMVVGYDVNFNFNRSNFDVRLKVLKYDFSASNDRIQADTKLLNNSDYKCEIPCIGNPVLKDSSNSSIVVGHHFFNDKENKKIGSYTFSYCPKENHYVNLPDFTFCALI